MSVAGAEVISIITATLNRPSLRAACVSVDAQTYTGWHHYVLGDGTLPRDYTHPQRTTMGTSRPWGAEERTMDMPLGTPNPIFRWALQHLQLGQYVCFLDDDNAYEPTFLEELLSLLEISGVGIALCAADNCRFLAGQKSHYRLDEDLEPAVLDGYPELGRCDNSAFIARAHLAKSRGFPMAQSSDDAIQDFLFISDIAAAHGWIRTGTPLVRYGCGENTPPERQLWEHRD